MDIDRPTPEYINDSPEPYENMSGDLYEFSNAIGGNLWRDEKSNKIAFERSISLMPDEIIDNELYYPIDNCSNLDQPQDIIIRFEAERELYDNGYYYTTYAITYVTETPVRLSDMPATYQEEFCEALVEFNEENDTQITADNMLAISETHIHEYSICEEDDSISYAEYITYEWSGVIEVEGQEFHSTNQREVVHGQDVDDFAFELGQYKDQVETTSGDPESIIYDQKFAEMTDENSDVKILFHSEDDHARRVTALIDLLGSGLIN